jgi:YHS domain-containing protein
MAIDLVCGMIVDEESAPDRTTYEGTEYFFCATYCREAFDRDPQKYIEGTNEWGNATDPVCAIFLMLPP